MTRSNNIQLTEAERRVYMSVNYAITGSDSRLSHVRLQAIIWINIVLLLTETWEQISMKS